MNAPSNKTKINIFLSGGGTKCSFQVGFLEKICSSQQFNKQYSFGSFYCISFGSLVGLFHILGKSDVLKTLLINSNERTIKRVCEMWGIHHILSKIPLLGPILVKIINLIWLIKGIFSRGMYKSDFGNTILNTLFQNINKNDPITIKKLEQFNCFVFNITKNRIERINGTNPQIQQYIQASICCWGLFPPIKIKQPDGSINEFLDAGFIQVHPYFNLLKHTYKKSQYKKKYKQMSLLLMTNTLDNMYKTHLDGTQNLIEYLIAIISYLMDRSDAELIRSELIRTRTQNKHIIQYLPRVTYPNEFDPIKINQMINDGMEHATIFLNKLNIL